MKVSMRGDYGIRALVDLADHYGEGPVQSREIAERQYIPEPYLDQLLTMLRKAGFIHSRRGPQGGHMLAKEPGLVPLVEVSQVQEGSNAVIGCLDGTINCELSGRCGQQEVWQELTDASQRLLAATTIRQLAERQKALQQRSMYHI